MANFASNTQITVRMKMLNDWIDVVFDYKFFLFFSSIFMYAFKQKKTNFGFSASNNENNNTETVCTRELNLPASNIFFITVTIS